MISSLSDFWIFSLKLLQDYLLLWFSLYLLCISTWSCCQTCFTLVSWFCYFMFVEAVSLLLRLEGLNLVLHPCFHNDTVCSLSTSTADPSKQLCQEERILYKLISGLHSSISIHIAADYLLDEANNLVYISILTN